MYIETERLVIRSLELTDEKAYVEMASDGTLTEIFGDCGECDKWMKDWLAEAISLDKGNNPSREYLAYAVLEKKSNIVVGSVGCSFYEVMLPFSIEVLCFDARDRRRDVNKYCIDSVIRTAFGKPFFQNKAAKLAGNDSCRNYFGSVCPECD